MTKVQFVHTPDEDILVSPRLRMFSPSVDGDTGYDSMESYEAVPEGGPYNVVSSECEDGMHRPCLDIDVPCIQVKSSTPGHSHLYFPTLDMTWEKYEKLLDALEEAGILEPGYVSASKARRATRLRPPHVKKGIKP